MKKYYLIRWTSLIGYGDESDERYADEASARAAAYSLLDTRLYEGIKVMSETIDSGESSSSSVAMIQTVKGPYDDEFGGVEYYDPKTGDMKGASTMKRNITAETKILINEETFEEEICEVLREGKGAAEDDA